MLEPIQPGAMVRHRNQASRLGVLTGCTFDGGVVKMAEVQWGDELKYEAVNVLESFVVNEVQSLEGLVARSVRWHRLLALSVVNRHPIGTLAQGLK